VEKTLDNPATPAWPPWVSLVARVIIGGAFLYAGLTKIGSLPQAVASVRAYQLPFPNWMITTIGDVLPIFEIVLGAALIAGLFTRWVAVIGSVVMLIYIIGISSAWIRGLNIDCGCFTPGGVLQPGQSTAYLQDILRDTGFLICGVWTVLRPDGHFSVDRWIAGPADDASTPTK
jgi:uncharacterized membrane protein YphA (DoxX/SURF4 family)